MKRIFTLLFINLFLVVGLFAQNTVYLKINHFLGEEPFALNEMASNNLNNTYMVERLEYYLSEIAIYHDGGQETIVEDTWILVNAAEQTQVELGSYDIDQVESIKLHIGVDEAHNHLDPASWPMDHPLAPQNPSMHWGWAAGYRFIALEGVAGPNLDQIYQLHALEDDNYTKFTIATTATAASGEVHIELNADYTKGLENIDVDGGLIIHGGYFEAVDLIQNFAAYVFEGAFISTNLDEVNAAVQFDIQPNPTMDGNVILSFDKLQGEDYLVEVVNAQGQQVRLINQISTDQNLQLSNLGQGIYYVRLMQNGQLLATRSLVVTK